MGSTGVAEVTTPLTAVAIFLVDQSVVESTVS